MNRLYHTCATLAVLLCALPAQAQRVEPLHLSQANVQAVEAVARIATGIKAQEACPYIPQSSFQLMQAQFARGTRGLMMALQQESLSADKAERLLRMAIAEGEKLGKHNFPPCANTAQDIIVKAQKDAACLEAFSQNRDFSCFR